MKATIDLPDELYRQVKAKSALEGRAIREVAVALFQEFLDGRLASEHAERRAAVGGKAARKAAAPAWLGISRRHLRQAASHEWSEIRKSIDRGWAGAAEEVAEPRPKPTRQPRPSKR